MKRVFIIDNSLTVNIGSDVSEILTNMAREIKPQMDSELGLPIYPITNFSSKEYIKRLREKRYLNRGALFATVNALRLWKTYSELNLDLDAGCIYIGVGPNLEKFDENNLREDKSPWVLNYLPNTAASVIAKRTGIAGESISLATACSASLQTLGSGYEKIKSASADYVLCASGDSRLSTNALLSYNSIGALFKGSGKYQPLNQIEFGFIPGEGGSSILLANENIAKQLGKTNIEVLAHTSNMDCYSLTSPHEEGRGLIKAVNKSLKNSGLESSDIDIIIAHGTGTEANDRVEKLVWKKIFSKSRPIIFVAKSWIGHLSSASGMTELSLLLECLKESIIPKSNLGEYIGDLEILSEKRYIENGSTLNILIESMGFGGQNTTLIVRYNIND